MIFLKHVEYNLKGRDDLESILARVRETAARVRGVRLRECFVLQGRDEFTRPRGDGVPRRGRLPGMAGSLPAPTGRAGLGRGGGARGGVCLNR